METQSSSNGVIIGILLVLVVLVIGFIAYKQGFLNGGSKDTGGSNIEVNLGGGNQPAQ